MAIRNATRTRQLQHISTRLENLMLSGKPDEAIALARLSGKFLSGGQIAEEAADTFKGDDGTFTAKGEEYLRSAVDLYSKGGWYSEASRVAAEKLGDQETAQTMLQNLARDEPKYKDVIKEFLVHNEHKKALEVALGKKDYVTAFEICVDAITANSHKTDYGGFAIVERGRERRKWISRYMAVMQEAMVTDGDFSLQFRQMKSLVDQYLHHKVKYGNNSEAARIGKSRAKVAIHIGAHFGDYEWCMEAAEKARLSDRYRIRFAMENGLNGAALKVARDSGLYKKVDKIGRATETESETQAIFAAVREAD